jgi:DNA-binding CsgD family transcriptional regulator
MEQEIIKLRREGKTAAEIKAATGFSYYRQRQIYESHNIPAPSRYGANRRRILELLNAGKMSQSEIARMLGVSRQLVSGIKRSEELQ